MSHIQEIQKSIVSGEQEKRHLMQVGGNTGPVNVGRFLNAHFILSSCGDYFKLLTQSLCFCQTYTY